MTNQSKIIFPIAIVTIILSLIGFSVFKYFHQNARLLDLLILVGFIILGTVMFAIVNFNHFGKFYQNTKAYDATKYLNGLYIRPKVQNTIGIFRVILLIGAFIYVLIYFL